MTILAKTIVELASYSAISVSTQVLPLGYYWPRGLWNDVIVNEGISMETLGFGTRETRPAPLMQPVP